MGDEVYSVHPVFSRWDSGWYGGHILNNNYWNEFFKRDPLGGSLVTCVELLIGDSIVLRVANAVISTPSTITGDVYAYLPVLTDTPRVKSSVTMMSPSSSARSYTVKLPNELVDASDIIKRGSLLAGYAELSLNYDGGEDENRLVLMRGEMDSGVTFYPADGGMIEFSITDPKESADVSIPPYTITEERFDKNAVGAGAMGRRFPLVLNKWPNVPCSFTHENAALIGYGYGMKPNAAEILVDGEPYDNLDMTYGFRIVRSSDHMGTPCQFVQFKFWEDLTEDRTESVYISVTDGEGGTNPVGQCEHLCRGYSVLGIAGINLHHFGRASAKAGGLTSQVCINAGGDGNVSTLAFIEGELLSNFPMIGMVWDRGSYGPVYIDRMLESSVRLTADQYPVLDRVSAVTESPKTEVFNSFTLKYNYTPYLDSFEGVVERNSVNSGLCNISVQQCGSRPMDALECVYVYDRATASRIIDWYVNHLSLPHYEVQYSCSPEIMVLLNLGDNILLTDQEFEWDDVKSTVVGIEYKESHCILSLIVWRPFYKMDGGSWVSPASSAFLFHGLAGDWPLLYDPDSGEPREAGG